MSPTVKTNSVQRIISLMTICVASPLGVAGRFGEYGVEFGAGDGARKL
jgi:hypothetical protein